MGMDDHADYSALVTLLAERFGDRLKLIVLFGSQSRAEARPGSDHDIFVVIEGLPQDPLARRRMVLTVLLSEWANLPERLSIIAKTPHELMRDLTALLIDVCMDGKCLYGQDYFESLRGKVRLGINNAGLQRQWLAGAWMWIFPTLPKETWELTWEGYRERV